MTAMTPSSVLIVGDEVSDALFVVFQHDDSVGGDPFLRERLFFPVRQPLQVPLAAFCGVLAVKLLEVDEGDGQAALRVLCPLPRVVDGDAARKVGGVARVIAPVRTEKEIGKDSGLAYALRVLRSAVLPKGRRPQPVARILRCGALLLPAVFDAADDDGGDEEAEHEGPPPRRRARLVCRPRRRRGTSQNGRSLPARRGRR